MKRLALALFLFAGCTGDDAGVNSVIVRLDNASDEVMLTIEDEVERGNLTVDDARAPSLSAPSDGATLPRDAAPTFAWSLPGDELFHGETTGQFAWLNLSGGGLEREIDVVGLDSDSWTPDGEAWTVLSAATAAITATITSAYVDRGIIEQGPTGPRKRPRSSLPSDGSLGRSGRPTSSTDGSRMTEKAQRDPRMQGAVYGLAAAALFGASAPVSKLLLPGAGPLLLAGLLHLGAGLGLSIYQLVRARPQA